MEVCNERMEDWVGRVQNYLAGYRFCVDMLELRRYERVHASAFEEEPDAELLAGNEAMWRARMLEIGAFIGSLPNGRAKLVLHYRYIKGLSIERISGLLSVSRRTGYRLHERGLLLAAAVYRRREGGK